MNKKAAKKVMYVRQEILAKPNALPQKASDNIGYLPAGITENEMISLYLKANAQAQMIGNEPAGR
jgi:hypothetical protein